MARSSTKVVIAFETRLLPLFLARLRDRAEAWDVDVRPSDTGVETMSNPVAVRIDVPGLSGPVTALWVLCHHAPEQHPILHGSWGNRIYVGDNHSGDPLRDLTVSGMPSTAEELADLAARWFEIQLRVDIYRDEWSRGPWSRRDAYGPVPPFRKGARTLVRSVLERSAGSAKGEYLT